MADPTVTVGIALDPADLARIATNAERATGEGVAAGAKTGAAAIKAQLLPAMEKFNAEAAKGVGSGGGVATGFEKIATSAKGLKSTFSATAQDTLNIASRFKELTETLTGLTAAIQRETSATKRASIDANSEATRASNASLIQLRNAGKQAAIEAQSQGQVQVREARTSGQQRVQITRSVLETIGRLEKGLGTTLSGIARTSVGAVSKAFDGLTSVFKRADKETFSSSTFSTSLKERESVLRSSFARQESTVRESITRQERQLTELREASNSGVLGAANRSGLLGGLAVGFAALNAVKSTFTVGADFSRGLAVLQASLDLTAADMVKVRQVSIDLGNDITLPGVSALDAAQAIQTLTKQFGALGPAAVTAAEAAAKGTLQLARASGASADDAAALIGAAVNVFGVSADDAVGAADKIAGALTRAAGVGFTDFKDSFVQGATVFEQFVGPTESANDALLDFNTTLAILAKNGITGSNAGAGLKQFFIQATQNTKSATRASETLAQRAGITGNVFFEASGKLRPFNESIDVLRKGVKGLNDEARTNILGDLFGSRSITIANALIGSTNESFATLREQIAKQGLAAKIAAAQNTGLKGALDALSSVAETVQIVFFEKIQAPIAAGVLGLTNFANAVLFGAGPALHTLRIGLLGAAAGLAAIVGLKAAVEVITLVGKAAALAFTPFGALVLLFSGLGAAIAIFGDKSKLLGETFDKVKGFASDLGDTLVAKAKPVIEGISNFIETKAIPTASRWASIVLRDLKGAFDATVGFVQETVIPGFQRFVGVLETDVFPKVAGVAEKVGTAVVRGKDAVVNFATDVGRVVGPLIAPAIDGFAKLGKSLGDLVSGNFSTIGSGLAAAGKGIGGAFANIGQAILPSLKSAGSTVLGFFKDLFSADNLITAVGGIGDFLNFIGVKLGEIVSNPKVIAAVGIVAGVAAKLALDLASGIVEGIASNVPRLLADAWQLAVKFAFKPEVLLAAVVGGLALLSGARLLANFRSLGEGGAAGFVTGFKSKVSAGGGFLSGLFKGPDATQSSAIDKIFGDFKRQLSDAQIKARALGSTKIYDASNSGLREAESDIARLSSGLSDAQIRGLQFRDKLVTVGTAVGGVFKGGGEIAKGVAQIPLAFGRAGLDAARSLGSAIRSGIENLGTLAFGNPANIANEGTRVGTSFGSKVRDGLKAAGSTIKAGFSQITDSLQAAAQKSGVTAGQALATGIKGAAVAAIAVGGGIAAGKALGSAKTGGDQVQAVAGLAATSLAVGAINPIAGVATAGIGLLTAALSDDGEAARIAAQNISDFSNVLKGELKDGTIVATDGIISLRDAINDTDFAATLGQKILEAKNGSVDLSDALKVAKVSLGDVQAAFDGGATGIANLTNRLTSSSLGLVTGSNAAAQLKAIYDQLNTSIGDVNDSNTFLASGQKDIVTGARSVVQGIKVVADAAADSGDALDRAGIKAGDLAQVFAKPQPTTGFSAALAGINAQIEDVRKKTNRGIIPNGTESNVQPALDVATALQNITDLKSTIDEQFSKGILPPGVTQFQDVINTAIQGVQGAGTNISAIIADNIAGNISDAVKSAKINDILKGIGDNAIKVIQEGVTEGLDPATIQGAVDQLKAEAERGLTDPVLIQQIEDTFANLQVQLQPTIDAATAAKAAADAVAGAQIIASGTIVDIPTGLDIPLVGPEFAGEAQATVLGISVQIPATIKLSDSGSGDALDGSSIAQQFRGGLSIPVEVQKPTIPAGFAQNAIAASASGGDSSGAALDAGMVRGIRGGLPGVVAAAAAVAAAAVNSARHVLQISSPSKVFAEIGGFVIAGLVKGLADGTDDVVSTVTDLVDKAVDAATGAVNDASKALRSGSSALFGALFGSGSVPGRASFGDIQGSITESFNSLASTLDSSFSRAADVLKRSATEALSRADLDVLGERGGSLNPNDVLGASNRSALAGTIDQIVDLGKALIDQGLPAAQVTATVRQYLDQTRALAVQYGLNGADVDALIAQLGLSGDALNGFVASSARLAEVLGTAKTSAEKLNDQIVDLFKGVTDGGPFKSITGVGAAEAAKAAAAAGLTGIAAAADAADAKAKEILDKLSDPTKNGPLTFADRLALDQGLNGRAINTTDQFGIANRAAFQTQLDNIKDYGQALLEGGSTAGFVTDTINQQIAALEAYGASLGFNVTEIQHLVETSGLGADSLAKFGQAVADAGNVANQAAAAAASGSATPPSPGALPPGSNAHTPAQEGPVRDVIVNQYLPYADPAAIALAAANGVASAVRLPV